MSLRLLPQALAVTLLAAPTLAQTLLVTHFSQNGGERVATVDRADGSLLSVSYLALRENAPVNRPEQAVPVGSEIWVPDYVLEAVHRWSADGGTFLGDVLTGYGDPHAGVVVGGKPWFTIGDPGFGSRFLVEVDGATETAHGLSHSPYGLIEFDGDLVYTHSRGLVRVDPNTGAELGDLVNVPFQGGYMQPTLRRSTGNLLVARQAGQQDIVEIDATGAQVAEYDVLATLGIGVMFAAYELDDGNFLVSADAGLYVVDPALTQATVVLDEVRCRMISEGPGAPLGGSFCPGVTNSTGRAGVLAASGSDAVADNVLRLAAHDLPSFASVLYLASPVQSFVPNAGGSQGILCLGAPTGRYVQQVDWTANVGFSEQRLDLTSVPQGPGSVAVQPGETWYWQVWYRDTVGGAATSNFTNGIAVTFQ